MASPIPLQLPPRDPRRELQVRLQNAPMRHAEALLDGYELLQQLHESGTLDILRGMLGSKDKIVEQGVEAVNTPSTIRAMRNLTILITALGEIDPEILGTVTHSLSHALAGNKEEKKEEKPPGFFALFSRLRSPDTRRGLAFVTTFFEKFGRNLGSERSTSNEQQ